MGFDEGMYVCMSLFVFVCVYVGHISVRPFDEFMGFDEGMYVCMPLYPLFVYIYTHKRIRACLCVLMCVSIHINDVCRCTNVSVNNKI